MDIWEHPCLSQRGRYLYIAMCRWELQPITVPFRSDPFLRGGTDSFATGGQSMGPNGLAGKAGSRISASASRRSRRMSSSDQNWSGSALVRKVAEPVEPAEDLGAMPEAKVGHRQERPVPRKGPIPVQGRKQGCAVQKVLIFSKCKSCPASGSLQPVAIEATRGGNETVGAFETDGSHGDSASRQAVTASERSSGLEKSNVVADPALVWGRPPPLGTGKRLE